MERRFYDGDPGTAEYRDSADAMVAEARGFSSVTEWREFRDASPERREQIKRRIRNHDDPESAELRRELAKLRNLNA